LQIPQVGLTNQLGCQAKNDVNHPSSYGPTAGQLLWWSLGRIFPFTTGPTPSQSPLAPGDIKVATRDQRRSRAKPGKWGGNQIRKEPYHLDFCYKTYVWYTTFIGDWES
jgi:hypothetical protein